jgi:two-component system CheB/CheR fusion protein
MVSNAIKYSPKADKVIILLKRTPQTAQIKIKDYGRGIDPQNLKNIFDQFRQNKESGGLGLGLYISQKIVKEHDGKINVTSKKGYGSVFTINLPLKKVK